MPNLDSKSKKLNELTTTIAIPSSTDKLSKEMKSANTRKKIWNSVVKKRKNRVI